MLGIVWKGIQSHVRPAHGGALMRLAWTDISKVAHYNRTLVVVRINLIREHIAK